MKYCYDFHIHTALSPCADDLMTPNNIVNMCKLNHIDVIAITDHNTCRNCQAVMEVGAKNNLLVIPGMEIECMEEFHSIALFPSIDRALEIEEIIKSKMLKIKNKIHIFGHQYLIDTEDEVMEEVEDLLVSACQIPAKKIYELVNQVGGVIYPAHIDRHSYSILSNLGSIPEELSIVLVEISYKADWNEYQQRYPCYGILQNSDAHYLEQLCKENNVIDLKELTIEAVLDFIKRKRY